MIALRSGHPRRSILRPHSASLALAGALAGVPLACGGSSSPADSPTNESAAASADADTSPNHPPVPPPAENAGEPISSPMLDDLEDGTGQIILADSRAGYWYTYKDEGSTIEPENPFQPTEGGANGSKFAARMKGTIGDSVQYPFAGMGFLFLDPKGAYDVSSCEGIKFLAKKGPEGDAVNMRLKVGDVNTVPEGGMCKQCYNDFGRDVLLTDEWTEIRAPFFEMKQEPYWGEPQPGLVATHVYQVQFQVVSRGTFDVWVDDVSLFGCKSSAD